jgi:hypothetical protein
MRRTAIATVLAAAALLVATVWMACVVSQGTNQPIQPGWWAFRYAALLLVAFAAALGSLLAVTIRPPANRSATTAIQVVAGLETLLFGVVWFALVVMPLSSP